MVGSPAAEFGPKLPGGSGHEQEKAVVVGGWRFDENRLETDVVELKEEHQRFGSVAGSAAERPQQPVISGRFRR